MKRTGLGMSACLLLLNGCQHRSPTEAIIDNIHHLQGGEVNRLHPPAPGYDQPYPRVSQTPTTTPDFPSPEARLVITQQLEEQRNIAQRVSAASGPLPTTNALNPLPLSTHYNNGSRAMNNHKDATHSTPQTSSQASNSPSMTNSDAHVIYQPINHHTPTFFPSISAAPPLPINFPGFIVPASVNAPMPDFETKTPAGSLVRFQPETDHLTAGQNKTFQKIIENRHHNYVIVQGFGTTLSASSGLSTTNQQHALDLGLLRAKTVTQRLIEQGVPADMIELSANPIGDGVRVLYRAP